MQELTIDKQRRKEAQAQKLEQEAAKKQKREEAKHAKVQKFVCKAADLPETTTRFLTNLSLQAHEVNQHACRLVFIYHDLHRLNHLRK